MQFMCPRVQLDRGAFLDSIYVVGSCWAIVVALLIPAVAYAQLPRSEINVIENRLSTAHSERDREYAEILSPDFVQIGPAGSLDDKKNGGLSWSKLRESSSCRDVAVSLHDDAAIVTGVVTGMPELRFLHV